MWPAKHDFRTCAQRFAPGWGNCSKESEPPCLLHSMLKPRWERGCPDASQLRPSGKQTQPNLRYCPCPQGTFTAKQTLHARQETCGAHPPDSLSGPGNSLPYIFFNDLTFSLQMVPFLCATGNAKRKWSCGSPSAAAIVPVTRPERLTPDEEAVATDQGKPT